VLQSLIGRSALAAVALTMVAAPLAAAIPRQNPATCRGQAEIRPLEAVQVRTDRGVQTFQVEIADTPREWEYGLMCRRALAPDRGMLFIFPVERPQAFWMRNTLIALDIIYIGKNGRVVSITRNARPLDETLLPSSGPASVVLELAAGRAAQIGLLPGDRIFHRTFPRD
jgi:uncharacterized protein